MFHGEEKYLMEQCLAQLRRQLVPEGMEEFNLHTFNGKDIDVGELVATMDNLPMMSERTLIIVTDFDLFGCNEKKKELLTEAFADLPDSLCLVFVYDLLDYKIGVGKFQNMVKKTAAIVDFAPAERGDLVDWIRRRFRELYRLHKPEMQPGYDVILVARGRAVRSTYQQLDETYLHLLRQAGLVPEETA